MTYPHPIDCNNIFYFLPNIHQLQIPSLSLCLTFNHVCSKIIHWCTHWYTYSLTHAYLYILLHEGLIQNPLWATRVQPTKLTIFRNLDLLPRTEFCTYTKHHLITSSKNVLQNFSWFNLPTPLPLFQRIFASSESSFSWRPEVWQLHSVHISYQSSDWPGLLPVNLWLAMTSSRQNSPHWIYYQRYFHPKPLARLKIFYIKYIIIFLENPSLVQITVLYIVLGSFLCILSPHVLANYIHIFHNK